MTLEPSDAHGLLETAVTRGDRDIVAAYFKHVRNIPADIVVKSVIFHLIIIVK